MTVKLTLQANLPDETLEPFLEQLRNFDRAHPGCFFRAMANGDGDETVGEIVRMLERVGIPLVFAAKTGG
jgi:hypothetical protein